MDFLKIDYAFVRSIESGSDPLEIIRTICTLARQLGLRVIAEGIENPRQLDLVRSLDCEYGQGFLFSKAVSGKQAETLLVEGFAPREDAHPPSSIRNDPGKSGRKPGFRIKRKYAFAGLTILILLLAGGLLARLNHLTSPPVAYTSPTASPAKSEKSAMTAAIPEIVPTPPTPETQTVVKADAGLKPPAAVPKTAKNRAALAVYRYPVVHDHRFGSCDGILRIGNDGIAYIANDGKDSFALKYSECVCIMDPEWLTVRSGSMVFRFKSTTAFDRDANRVYLSEIYRSISRFNPDPVSRQQ